MRNGKLKILISCICLITIYANAYSELRWEVNGITYASSDYTHDRDGELCINTAYVSHTSTYSIWGSENPISQYSGDITIPAYIVVSGQAVPVTAVGEGAFYGSDVTSVTLPYSVKTIAIHAFKGCSKLTKVIMPEVEGIGRDAFAGCGLIEKITLPLSLSDCKLAFRDMSGLKEFEVEEGNPKFCAIDGILYNHDITRLVWVPATRTTVQIPNTVTEISFSSFYKSSISSIEIPYSVHTIRGDAFYGTENLKSVTIPKTVKKIEEYAFYESGIERLEYLSTSSDCRYAFWGCDHISEIIFSPELSRIPDSMFEYCHFKNLKISLYSIGPHAFAHSYIENLILDWNVCKIYYNAFLFEHYLFKHTNIENIYCLGSTPPEFEYPEPVYDPYNPPDFSDPFETFVFDECNLIVYDNYLRFYKAAEYWRDFKNIKTIPPTTAVKEVADSSESYTINGNTISVEAEAGTAVAIYSIDGILRFEGKGAASIDLASGLYILRIGSQSHRIRI